MNRMNGILNGTVVLLLASISLVVEGQSTATGEPPASLRYVWAQAYHIPPETTTGESGYFALCEGRNGKIYIGTAAYGCNSYLVEFDPATEKMRVVLDTHKLLGLPLEPTGYAAQAKIHTRLFVGPSGTIYLGSMMGYPTPEEWKTGKIATYRGGYVITYDPATGVAKNLGMPMPLGDRRQVVWPPPTEGQGVIDVVADESRGLIYIITNSGGHWMLYDTHHPEKGYRHLGPILETMSNTLIDRQGRATALTRDYQVARYDPATGSTTLDELLVDRQPFREAVSGTSSSPDWRLAPDGRTAYLLRNLRNELCLVRIDLGGRVGRPVRARSLKTCFAGHKPEARGSLSIVPDGNVYADVWVDSLPHLVRYDPRTRQMADLGVIAVRNPDFYDFDGPPVQNPDGSVRFRGGFQRLPDGTLVPTHNILALHVAHDGTLYATVLYPFTLLRIPPP